jgi:hypothetical protein
MAARSAHGLEPEPVAPGTGPFRHFSRNSGIKSDTGNEIKGQDNRREEQRPTTFNERSRHLLLRPPNMATTKTKPTPAQYAARQANAQKATGPRSDDGKSRASKNALLHGLCSLAPVLPGEDPAEFEAMLAQYLKEMDPGNADERRMVYDMACAARAADRVRKADAAAALVRMRQAGEAWDKQRAESLREPASLVTSGRNDLVYVLLERADGVRRLIGLWERFDEQLDRCGYLDLKERQVMATLLGCRFDDLGDDRAREVHGLGMALEVARGADTEAHAKLLKRGVAIDNDRPMERLRALIAGELEALRSILPDLEAEAAEQRQQAMDAAAVDTSDEGARRHRYLQDHQRTMRQLSAALIASKTARLKLYGRILSSSALRGEPDWTPQAPAAPAPQAAPRNEPKNDAISSSEPTSVECFASAPAGLVSKLRAAWSPRPQTAVPSVV